MKNKINEEKGKGNWERKWKIFKKRRNNGARNSRWEIINGCKEIIEKVNNTNEE